MAEEDAQSELWEQRKRDERWQETEELDSGGELQPLFLPTSSSMTFEEEE